MKLLGICVLSAIMALTASAGDAGRIVYQKKFPGSTPPYVLVTVESNGNATYNESEDPDNADTLHLEETFTREIFRLADRLDHFQHPLDSGNTKLANMGLKTLRWEEGAAHNESTFNYSTNEDARLIAERFENVTESARLLLELRRVIKHDRLGVNASVNGIYAAWQNRRLVATADFLPVLDQVAKNDVYIHMAREKAAELVDAIRAAK